MTSPFPLPIPGPDLSKENAVSVSPFDSNLMPNYLRELGVDDVGNPLLLCVRGVFDENPVHGRSKSLDSNYVVKFDLLSLSLDDASITYKEDLLTRNTHLAQQLAERFYLGETLTAGIIYSENRLGSKLHPLNEPLPLPRAGKFDSTRGGAYLVALKLAANKEGWKLTFAARTASAGPRTAVTRFSPSERANSMILIRSRDFKTAKSNYGPFLVAQADVIVLSESGDPVTIMDAYIFGKRDVELLLKHYVLGEDMFKGMYLSARDYCATMHRALPPHRMGNHVLTPLTSLLDEVSVADVSKRFDSAMDTLGWEH